jgi:short-subunit dehydrogenase
MLYRSLALEHPKIHFAHVCPATIQGNFRASAVDGGQPREVLADALSPDEVAEKSIRMVDRKEGIVIIPFKYFLGLLASWVAPWITERYASKKYTYKFA